MKAKSHSSNPIGPSLHLLCALAGVAVFTGTIRAGESFNTFIKSVDMSQAYSLSITDNFPWDTVKPSNVNKPFADLKANGANYVRLNCWLTTDKDADLDLYQLTVLAKYAKGNNGLKLYIDAVPADGGQPAGSYPTEWQSAYDTATEGGTNFDWDPTRGAALAADVKAFYSNIVTTLAAAGQNTPADIVSIGNEINDSFCGVPQMSGTHDNSLYYELIYKGAAGVKEADSSIAVMLHLHDISNTVWIECNKLANCQTLEGTPAIDFDVFGFSFHPETNPLDNPSWEGSQCLSNDQQPIGIKQAFQTENLAQFKNGSTGFPDSNNPIYLMVAETSWIWTTSSEIINGTSYAPNHTSLPGQNAPGLTNYGYDSSAYLQYLSDECTDVSGLNDGYGKGVNDWAGSVIEGWATPPHGDWNMAFWDSATGALKTTANGTPILSAFTPAY